MSSSNGLHDCGRTAEAFASGEAEWGMHFSGGEGLLRSAGEATAVPRFSQSVELSGVREGVPRGAEARGRAGVQSLVEYATHRYSNYELRITEDEKRPDQEDFRLVSGRGGEGGQQGIQRR